MHILGSIIGIVMVLIGGLWTLQGSNVLAGSVMSGQSQWLYVGIIVAIVGFAVLWWFNLRGRMR